MNHSTVTHLGIVGAGQMGAGIAQVAVCAGLHVVLVDRTERSVERARELVAKGIGRLCSKGTLSDEAGRAASDRLSTSLALTELGACQLVVEAISENEEAKRGLYERVCGVLAPGSILATNTSSISITRLATATDRPERFVGMHFMNPVPLMGLVEVIGGLQTSESTLATVEALAGVLGKTTIRARDYPGFVVNRVLIPMINEACFALMEQVASAADIDAAMKLGCNQPMGPLTLADLIGLDTVLAIMEVLHEGYGDPRYRPCPLLRNYVAAGWLGRKSGRGFYTY